MERMIENPRLMMPIQRVSHFPNNKMLHRKDCLAVNMRALTKLAPSVFDFTPASFCVSSTSEVAELEEYVQKRPPATVRMKMKREGGPRVESLTW